MISILLFLVGLMLYNRRRASFNLLKIQTEGEHVRRAGMVLMLPLAGSILLGFVLGFATGGDTQALLDAIEAVAFLELAGDISAVVLAYLILKRSPGIASSPGGYTSPSQPRYSPPAAQVTFPSVMSTQEAARYLNVPEQRILDAIYNGELAAAHIGNRYSVSRMVLDEFRETLKNDGRSSLDR